MGAMPLFMAPEPEELSELAVAAKLEREARRAAAEEQKRKERMERRREEAAAEAEVTSHVAVAVAAVPKILRLRAALMMRLRPSPRCVRRACLTLTHPTL